MSRSRICCVCLQWLFVLLLAGTTISQETLAEKQKANTVSLRLDRNGTLLEESDWKDDDTNEVRDFVFFALNTYCETSECSTTPDGRSFKRSDVMVANGPVRYNGDIKLGIYVSFDMEVVTKATLHDAIVALRDECQIELSDETIATIAHVDNSSFDPAYDSTMDIVMILVSVLVLLAACLLALVLKCREDHAHKQMVKSAETGQSKPTASSTVDGENVTLTAIKSSPYKDEGSSAEGSRHLKRNQVAPSISVETQTVGHVVIVSEKDSDISTVPCCDSLKDKDVGANRAWSATSLGGRSSSTVNSDAPLLSPEELRNTSVLTQTGIQLEKGQGSSKGSVRDDINNKVGMTRQGDNHGNKKLNEDLADNDNNNNEVNVPATPDTRYSALEESQATHDESSPVPPLDQDASEDVSPQHKDSDDSDRSSELSCQLPTFDEEINDALKAHAEENITSSSKEKEDGATDGTNDGATAGMADGQRTGTDDNLTCGADDLATATDDPNDTTNDEISDNTKDTQPSARKRGSRHGKIDLPPIGVAAQDTVEGENPIDEGQDHGKERKRAKKKKVPTATLR